MTVLYEGHIEFKINKQVKITKQTKTGQNLINLVNNYPPLKRVNPPFFNHKVNDLTNYK